MPPKAPVATTSPRAPDAKGNERERRGFLIGADLGIASGGTSNKLFGSGFGSALIFGFRSNAIELKLRFAESYDLRPDPVLKDAIDGSLDVDSAVLSYWLSPYQNWRLGVGAGPALVSSSLLVSRQGQLSAAERKAVGLVWMLAASLPLGDTVDLVVSLHGYSVFWEHPTSTVIEDIQDEMIVRTLDPANGIPISVGAGFRVQL